MESKTNLVPIIDHSAVLDQGFHDLKLVFLTCHTQWRGSKVIILCMDIHNNGHFQIMPKIHTTFA
jgi:hypothetical protein